MESLLKFCKSVYIIAESCTVSKTRIPNQHTRRFPGKEKEKEMTIVLIIAGLLLFLVVWVFLWAFVGPALAFWTTPIMAGFYIWFPHTGMFALIVWTLLSIGLVSYLRCKQGTEEYLASMSHLRYNVGGPGGSFDFQTLIWTFLMPGRIALKLLRLESAPEARDIKSVPLSLGDCVRYFE